MSYWHYVVSKSILLTLYTLRIGPPPGGPDRRRITVPHRWFSENSTILSDFRVHGVSKATPGTTKITRFYVFSQVGRRRALFTIARPSFVFFVVILWWIFGDFDIFSSIAWAKQHRERQKLTRFDAFPQVKRRHAFLIITTSIFTIFRDHFSWWF